MYATPIIYPLSEVPEQYQIWVSLNPMTPIVEAFRYSLLSKGSLSIYLLIYATAFAFTTLLSGMYFFKKTERRVVDYL